MIDDTGDTSEVPSWSATSKGVNVLLTHTFEALVNDKDFMKLGVLQTLRSPLSTMTRHSELASAKNCGYIN